MSEPDLDFIVDLIDRAEIPKAEKAYLKAATETHGGIPDITGDRQYEAYVEFCKELRRGIPEHGSPGFSRAFVQWARSRDGIYATAFAPVSAPPSRSTRKCGCDRRGLTTR